MLRMVLIGLVLGLTTTAVAQPYTVISVDSNDPLVHDTIQEAVDEAIDEFNSGEDLVIIRIKSSGTQEYAKFQVGKPDDSGKTLKIQRSSTSGNARVVITNSNVTTGSIIASGSNLTVELEELEFSGYDDLNGYWGALSVLPYGTTDGTTVTITDCDFLNNTQGNFPGGGAGLLVGPRCDVTATSCDFKDNEGNNFGGAIWVYGNYNVSQGEPWDAGPGADFPTITLDGCVFEDNVAQPTSGAGGAIAITSANATITDCTFTGNESPLGGGAIYGRYTDDLVVEDCDFDDNASTASVGGAIYINRAFDSTTAVFENCYFIANEAEKAGAMCVLNGNADIVRCFFDNNVAQYAADALGIRGGVTEENQDPGEVDMTVDVVNCLFVRHSDASGTHPEVIKIFTEEACYSTPCDPDESLEVEVAALISHCTITENGGVAILTEEYANTDVSVSVLGSILRENEDDSSEGVPISWAYCCTDSTHTGTGNTTTDPDFIDPATDNFRLSSSSVCIDSGWPHYSLVYPSYDTDAGNNDREVGDEIDMGCFEDQTP